MYTAMKSVLLNQMEIKFCKSSQYAEVQEEIAFNKPPIRIIRAQRGLCQFKRRKGGRQVSHLTAVACQFARATSRLLWQSVGITPRARRTEGCIEVVQQQGRLRIQV